MPGEAIFPLDVFRGQDFYVPTFRVLVGGKELMTEMNDIQSVTFTVFFMELIRVTS